MLAFLGLGSNIQPERNLRLAAAMLRKHWPALVFSHVYKSAPVGKTDQPEFLNAVARIRTGRSPIKLQRILRSIEQTLGKATPVRFGPRTIDLDILLYGNQIINRPSLTIPHPRMYERRFVLKPLMELTDPKSHHPSEHCAWDTLLSAVRNQSCKRTDIAL